MRFLPRVLVSGTLASVASALAGMLCSRFDNRHGARPMNAVAHIYDGGFPPSQDSGGRNTAVGIAIHTAASLWWGLFFESLPEKYRSKSGATVVAGLAYLVDYHVVHRRFRPGFEAHLSRGSLFAVYAALAAGFTAGAALNRRLDHHQEKDSNEGDERRPAKRRPGEVVMPEAPR
jgi:hypothetical protein